MAIAHLYSAATGNIIQTTFRVLESELVASGHCAKQVLVCYSQWETRLQRARIYG